MYDDAPVGVLLRGVTSDCGSSVICSQGGDALALHRGAISGQGGHLDRARCTECGEAQERTGK